MLYPILIHARWLDIQGMMLGGPGGNTFGMRVGSTRNAAGMDTSGVFPTYLPHSGYMMNI